jgi:hypothetical protein
VRVQQFLTDHGGLVFGPVTLQAAHQAFDAAWTEIAPLVSDNTSAEQHIRFRLAGAVLAVTRDGDTDVDTIKWEALKTMQLRG